MNPHKARSTREYRLGYVEAVRDKTVAYVDAFAAPYLNGEMAERPARELALDLLNRMRMLREQYGIPTGPCTTKSREKLARRILDEGK